MVLCVLLILAMATVSLAVDLTDVLHHQPYPDFRLLSQHEAEFVPDLRDYTMVFQSCKVLEVPDYDERKHVLPPREQYVIFRLCSPAVFIHDPSCSHDHFGEYAVFLKDYLSEIVPYQRNDHYMELVTPYIHCQMIYDPPHTDKRLYAGPLCSGNKNKNWEITMGVFTDPYCMIPDPTKDVDDYVTDEHRTGCSTGLQEWWVTFFYYLNESYLFFCLETSYGPCKSLYSKSSRCEIPHGFKPITDGETNYVPYGRKEETEESWDCKFIERLKASEATNYGQHQSSKLFVDWIVLASLGLAAGVAMVLVRRKFRKKKQSESSAGGTEWGGGGREYYELIPMDRT